MTAATPLHMVLPTAGGALSFPQPKFATGRRKVGKSRGSYTLVSDATGRCWITINSLRKCLFGEVLRAVEVRETPSGKWVHAAAPSPPTYFAIKELSLQTMLEMQGRTHEDPLREVAALQYFSGSAHDNVLQCTEVLRDEERMYIVTPFYSGGELFERVTDKGRFLEDEARPLFRQVLKGLRHLKRHGVCHRDLSLENLLLVNEGNSVKIIDLGLALRIPQAADGRAMPLLPQGPCGKRPYMSPEVLTSSAAFDGFAVDIWACGVMLFVMLTGIPPFDLALPSRDQRCRVIAVEEKLGELMLAWRLPLSPEVINLMQSCLLYAPGRRSTLEELLAHPWVTA